MVLIKPINPLKIAKVQKAIRARVILPVLLVEVVVFQLEVAVAVKKAYGVK